MSVDFEALDERLQHLPGGAVRMLLVEFMTPQAVEQVLSQPSDPQSIVRQHAAGAQAPLFEKALYRVENLCRLIGVSVFESDDDDDDDAGKSGRKGKRSHKKKEEEHAPVE